MPPRQTDKTLRERLWDAEWFFLLVGLLFGTAAGYLVGRANHFGLSYAKSMEQLGSYFTALLWAALSIAMWWCAAWVAFKPRRTFEDVKDWSKVGVVQTIVLKVSDNYLALSAIAMAIIFASAVVGADVIRALLPFGGNMPPSP